jgi:hypothetical protein
LKLNWLIIVIITVITVTDIIIVVVIIIKMTRYICFISYTYKIFLCCCT